VPGKNKILQYWSVSSGDTLPFFINYFIMGGLKDGFRAPTPLNPSLTQSVPLPLCVVLV